VKSSFDLPVLLPPQFTFFPLYALRPPLSRLITRPFDAYIVLFLLSFFFFFPRCLSPDRSKFLQFPRQRVTLFNFCSKFSPSPLPPLLFSPFFGFPSFFEVVVKYCLSAPDFSGSRPSLDTYPAVFPPPYGPFLRNVIAFLLRVSIQNSVPCLSPFPFSLTTFFSSPLGQKCLYPIAVLAIYLRSSQFLTPFPPQRSPYCGIQSSGWPFPPSFCLCSNPS